MHALTAIEKARAGRVKRNPGIQRRSEKITIKTMLSVSAV